MKSNKKDMSVFPVLILFAIVISAFYFYLALFYKKITSSEILDNKGVWKIILLLIIITVIHFSYEYTRKVLSLEKKRELQLYIMSSIYRKDFKEISTLAEGKLLSLMTNDLKLASKVKTKILLDMIYGGVSFLFALLYGVSVSLKLTGVIIMLSGISFILPKIYSKIIKTNHNLIMKENEDINDFLFSINKNKFILQIYKGMNFALSKFEEKFEKFRNIYKEKVKAESQLRALNFGLGFLINTLWLVYGLYLVRRREILLGELLGLMIFSEKFNWIFFKLTGLINDYIKNRESLKRIKKIGNNISEKKVQKYKNADYEKFVGINIDNVSASYNENQEIKYPDLTINKNEKISIIGNSGAGKSTFLHIMSGLINPDNGKVKYEFEDSSLNADEIDGLLSYVPQNISLFNDTIRFNISFDEEGIKDSTIIELCQLFNLKEFLGKYNNDLNSKISISDLSGGEKQRLVMVRALVRNPKIIFIDEFSSALDMNNENIIIDKLKNMDCTVINIAHKENVIKQFDRIIEICR